MSTVRAATVPVLLGWRCPECGDTFLRRVSLTSHAAGLHATALLPWEIDRATVELPPRCAFGRDHAPLAVP